MTDLIGIKLTDVSSTAQFTPGTKYQDPDTGKLYKYVQYDTGAGSVAAVVGQVCYYYLASGYNNNKVTSDLSDSVNLGAGVLLSAPTDSSIAGCRYLGRQRFLSHSQPGLMVTRLRR